MLEIKNIKKEYETKYFKQKALNGVSLSFRTNEFVAVLGPSGSGKTTLLNIIGGLDQFDEGDIVINGKSTKKFKNRDWDAYRNNCIGFVFQSYNLITHISVLANIEMGMTLSGVKSNIRREKALAALDKVGLKEHAFKTPNQLSGGQMQRVAIARALVNDPDIILADEPTGALDSKTSVEIMNLITEIAQDKLVIMVTHNRDLAEEYANRVIELKDGKMEKDSNPIKAHSEKENGFNIKKTAMGFFTALKLSANNIRTKKWRTGITAFASSIGIIGIALILALSNGLQMQIDDFERGTLSQMPIMISTNAMQFDALGPEESDLEQFSDATHVYPLPSIIEQMTHRNNITSEFIDYVNNIDQELIAGMSFMRATNLNVIANRDGVYLPLGLGHEFMIMPEKRDDNRWELVNNFYDVIEGRLPENKNELILMVDSRNRVNESILEALGFGGAEQVNFADLLDVEMRLVANDDFFQSMGIVYIPSTDFGRMYDESEVSLRIVGIIRGKEEHQLIVGGDAGMAFTEELMQHIYEMNRDSRIVRAQREANHNIMTGEMFAPGEDGERTKAQVLTFLGADLTPSLIQIFPRDFNSKELVLEYLDAFNEGRSEEDQIIYTDMAALISGLTGSLMNGVTFVLIGFSAISLVVSSIMIGIITYISVLERTKEIGILRALGARKKDITRVFNAETFIIGLTSGMLGITIAYFLTFPINRLIYGWTDLANVARLNPLHALMLIIVSLTLTLLGGFIPSKIASKKDPVEALRTE